MAPSITDDDARTLRRAWFDYLDAVEPLRKPLHAYGMRLTGNVWDAEDLVQETLLRGFALIGRGDLHGAGSPVASARAYLFRTATHLYIDARRRMARERAILAEPKAEPGSHDPDTIRAAGEILFTASPQARAAVVLKDVFDFTLEEIADQLRTTVGGVKAALSRGRAIVHAAAPAEPSGAGPSRELVDRFIDAFNSGDVPTMTAVLTETCSIEVPGVGGGRGRGGGWAEASLGHAGVELRTGVYEGENVVLFLSVGDGPAKLYDVLRLEGDDTHVARLVHHCYCPDTVAHIGAELALPTMSIGYHQGPDTLVGMIASTTLPWARG